MKTENNQLLDIYKNSLESYKEQLSKNPNSTFYKGLVKNMESIIEDIINKNKK